MFAYDFMVHAFMAVTVVAVVSGMVGFFVVVRGQSFAAHALAHVGFTGATGAVLAGVSPLWGLLAATVLAGVGMGWLGDRMVGRDVATGMVLALALGVGLLFLHFFTSFAGQATSLLFGNVLGVDLETVRNLTLLAVACVVGLALISRPLLFASLQPEIAQARGVSLRLLSVLFMALLAVAIAECVQIVGVLLVFALLVGPAATARRLTSCLWPSFFLSVALALATAWSGLAAAYWSDWPTSFWITAFGSGAYLLAGFWQGYKRGRV